MTNYSEMYHILFNKITDIIEELQDVQRQTEEMYLQCQKHETIALQVYNINQSKHVGDTVKNIEKRPLR
ncbi:hypothetical protein [Desulfitobacterium chlororespirans]|uniref:Uncharacterized protein n=1 Tax=Desulfitobacterium chlororespirans DSM 11544 TaxID=1121395 RepID=A0A1M7RWQ2_9FIRM|nr:hypothetical protein [Desulfitobacterium chlororespirans]SHN50544.1 hypothetical protein SAMN02745215_00196 [Desulfitobacterium chlororespirans DSM 11544]